VAWSPPCRVGRRAVRVRCHPPRQSRARAGLAGRHGNRTRLVPLVLAQPARQPRALRRAAHPRRARPPLALPAAAPPHAGLGDDAARPRAPHPAPAHPARRGYPGGRPPVRRRRLVRPDPARVLVPASRGRGSPDDPAAHRVDARLHRAPLLAPHPILVRPVRAAALRGGGAPPGARPARLRAGRARGGHARPSARVDRVPERRDERPRPGRGGGARARALVAVGRVRGGGGPRTGRPSRATGAAGPPVCA
jgi:hypothetical protein